jgi:hypothetical protein
MRAADAIEKITVCNQDYLKPHKMACIDQPVTRVLEINLS